MIVLPEINPDALATVFDPQTTPSLCQLSVFEGQYLLSYQEDSTRYVKLLSSAAVRAAFVTLPVDSGFLPPGVVRWGSAARDWLVQFIPAARYTLQFVPEGASVRLTIPLPSLVFMGLGDRYYLWAVKGKAFDPNAPAFHAPLPNIDRSGAICFGGNATANASTQTLQPTWQLFLDSPFNSDLAYGKSRSSPQDVGQLLLKLHQEQKKRYPQRDLIPTDRTITDLVEQLTE